MFMGISDCVDGIIALLFLLKATIMGVVSSEIGL